MTRACHTHLEAAHRAERRPVAQNLVQPARHAGHEARPGGPDVADEESVPSVVIAKTIVTIAQARCLLIGVGLAWTMLPTDSR